MKAVIIKAFGAPEGLSVVDLPDPTPGPTEVLIAVDAIGVGGVDALIRNGSLAGWGFTEGLVPGSEVAGTVAAVGNQVDESWIGRRVWGFTGLGGGYADHATAAIDHVVPLPDDLSAVDAVTLGSSGVVAHFALEHAHFEPGESVLVRGAAGSIGILTVQLAAQRGASAVAVTTSSAKRGERLRELGATHVLDRSTAGDAPPAYDVIVDVVAGPDLPTYFGKLNPNGRLVVVGVVGGQPPADFGTALMSAFRTSLTFSTFSADTVPAEERRTVRAEQFAASARGELPSVVHEQLSLDDAALAHHKIDAGEVFGRIVLIP
ncbi:NADPH:quinone reductase-like Zn-dependent oxidoreductase [Kribbella rubisoli]|uniref:NADPH:quinone reductase-like Zn-dependent oxidoreductase n=1 Tax=Kribbella rubisoli TaxID=3075929 RepID=A0A4Q7WLW7_9ACTN|nr:zinc-binding dehydrogenase [Kribbella rubisoli]RZU11082.1 NADPH:quinone reductase-like Zn-dependent oxidoreductase [Kribbella rubisoli]